jgi:GT2 family glycosyltransferase
MEQEIQMMTDRLTESALFRPARMIQIDLAEPIPTVIANWDGCHYERAIALIKLFGRPLGTVELPLHGQDLPAETCANHIWQALSADIIKRLQQEEMDPAAKLSAAGLSHLGIPVTNRSYQQLLQDPPFATVVIATHNRTSGLAQCLESLLAMDYPAFDIVVVDNAPSTDETAEFMRTHYGHSEQVRYVCEPRPGLAIAHNRGLQEVTAPFVAFTDDDVLVNEGWLTQLLHSFTVASNVGCVTGMIWPAEMETPAQAWIEQYGGFSKGFERRLFDIHKNRLPGPLFPYAAGSFGSGANMAFRTDALQAIGGFDPDLGAGSGGMGGDDLAAFFQIVANGYTLVYEPAAIVNHWHYKEYARLQRTAYGYGVGLTAYLTSTLVNNPKRILDFLLRVPFGIAYALNPQSPKNKNKQTDYPSELTRLERRGMLFGPVAYLRSRWQSRNFQTL